MKRVLKIVLWLVAVLVAVVVLAAVALALFFDPNDYRGEIAKLVHDKTGRELRMGGNLRLTFFPWLGVEVADVALADAPGFGREPFAQVGQLQVRVKLLPLLKRQVEMGTVVVDGLVLHLIKDAHGRDNWQDLAAGPKAPTTAAPGKGGGGPPPVAGLALGGLDVRNARVVWQDLGTGSRYAVTGLDLHTNALRLDRPVEVTVACDVESAAPSVTGHVELRGAVTADLAGQRVSVEGAHFSGRVRGAPLRGGEATAELSAALGVDLARHTLQVSELRATATFPPGGLPVGGKVTAAGALDLDLARSRLHATGVVLTADLRGTALPGGALAGSLATQATADLATESATLDDLHLHALDLDLRGRLSLAQWSTAPTATGDIEVAPFAPRALLDRLGQPPPTCADPKVLGRASLTTQFRGTPTSLQLSKLQVVLDDSKLTGTLAVDGLDRPAVRGDLALDGIDLDRYLPPPAKGQAAPAPATPGAAAGAATELPLDTLRTLDVAATLRAGRVKVANLRVSDVVVTAAAKDGQLRFHPATAHLYGGEYRGDVRLDARGKVPVVRLDETLAGVDLGSLLRDAVGEERVTGKANLHAQITARGAGADAIMRTASGTAEFRIANGAVRGVNLGRILRDARAALARAKGEEVAPVQEVAETDFAEATGTLHIDQGKVRNDDLAAKSPLLRVHGAGQVDLVRETVDYLLTTTVVETRTGQGGKELSDLAGIPIPVRISGPFAKLEYRPDLRGVIKERAATAVQERLHKELDKRLKDQVPEDLRKGLEKGLKGLFP